MYYKELNIYKIAARLQNELYKELSSVLNNWKVPEIDQVIRSSSSVTSNIVEGHSRKFYPKDYFRFLNISMSSSDETANHVLMLFSKRILNQKQSEYFHKSYRSLSIKILNLMQKIRTRNFRTTT